MIFLHESNLPCIDKVEATRISLVNIYAEVYNLVYHNCFNCIYQVLDAFKTYFKQIIMKKPWGE